MRQPGWRGHNMAAENRKEGPVVLKSQSFSALHICLASCSLYVRGPNYSHVRVAALERVSQPKHQNIWFLVWSGPETILAWCGPALPWKKFINEDRFRIRYFVIETVV
jgi:hypothetical protein